MLSEHSPLNTINDPLYISDLFRNLARKKEVPVLVKYQDQKLSSTIYFKDRKASDVFIANNCDLPQNQAIDISFIYKEVPIMFSTQITDILTIDDVMAFKIQKPSAIFSSFNRLTSRYEATVNDDIYISVPELSEGKYKVMDISSKGVSFYTDNNQFSVNQTVKNITIHIGDEDIQVDGVIKNVRGSDNTCIYGMSY